MRTKTLVLAAALSAAGIISSVAQSNVYSINVVGYVNRDCAGNGAYTLLANPLDSGTNTFNGVLAAALPANSKVLKWNGTGFNTYTRSASGWVPPSGGATTLNPGEGFFVQTPAGSSTVPITFVGNVLQGSLTNSFPLLFNLSGNLFPDSGTLTSLGMTPPAGDKILLWNGVGYNTYTKSASGWVPPAGPSINVADGFFVNTPSGTFDWVRNVTVN